MSAPRRNAVVTGGASGIGRAISLRLARDGANVAILDVNLPGAELVAEQVRAQGRLALAVEVDVSKLQDVALAIEQVRQHMGAVSILVNDAGIAQLVSFDRMTEQQWDRMIAVHVKGAFNCTRVLVGDMTSAGWGRIVNISSVAGLSGAPGFTHYSAAKAALIGFTKALAHEVGPKGVTVNAIACGMIDTPMLRGANLPEAALKQAAESSPIRRIGRPEDIAAACAYLVSDEAEFVTGQVMSPNGGRYM